MPIFKKITSILFPAPGEDVLWLYIQCSRCGKKFKIRINKNNDLTPEYGESDSFIGYQLTKEAMDDKCFSLITVHLTLNKQKQITSQEAKGGKLLSEEEFNRPS